MVNSIYTDFENDFNAATTIYEKSLTVLTEKINSNIYQVNDLHEYLDVAIPYFHKIEKTAPIIYSQRKSLGGEIMGSFADDCFVVLESYILHAVLIKALLKRDDLDEKIILSDRALANTQRIAKKYSSKGIKDLMKKFKEEGLSIYGFQSKFPKDESNQMKEYIVAAIGLAGIVVVVFLSFTINGINNWQQFLLRAFFSISLAMFSILLKDTGMLSVNLKHKFENQTSKVIATEALAIFVIIYFVTPSAIN